jgi:D-inositol-3-phosphate glycosyltransferase
VAIESMACGTPVVASRVGGLASTISDGETGYLIPWRCPEPFAERLELLLDNDELRASFGRAAREAVERFRWANVADAVSEMYDELLIIGVPSHLRAEAGSQANPGH